MKNKRRYSALSILLIAFSIICLILSVYIFKLSLDQLNQYSAQGMSLTFLDKLSYFIQNLYTPLFFTLASYVLAMIHEHVLELKDNLLPKAEAKKAAAEAKEAKQEEAVKETPDAKSKSEEALVKKEDEALSKDESEEAFVEIEEESNK